MKPKTIIPLVIGLGVGFFAIKLGIDMVKKAKGSQEETSGVVVSAKPIEVASAITNPMLTTKDVAASLVPDGAFVDRKALVGRVTRMPIAPGVPITKSMLAPPGAQPGLGAKIPPGYRAVSISVNEESSVAGFITPGCRVDVSAVYGRATTRSKLILSNVEVGAVGQSLSRTGSDGKTVRVTKSATLFLTPDQVQTLNSAVGGGRGRLRLAMRGHGNDPSESLLSKWLKRSSESRPAPVIQPKPEPKQVVVAQATPKPQPVEYHTVELRRGENVEQLVFDQKGGVHRFKSEHQIQAAMIENVSRVESEHQAPDTQDQNNTDMEAGE